MGEPNNIPMTVRLKRAVKRLKAMSPAERLELVVRAGILKEPQASEARARLAARAAAGQPPAP